jgi:hypothetical protein
MVYDNSDDEGGPFDPYLLEELDDDLADLRVIFDLRRNERSIRKPKYFHNRINWDEHIEMLEYTNNLEQRFRMTHSSLKALIEELREPLTVCVSQLVRSTNRNDPIYPEVIVACGLRFLGHSADLQRNGGF